MRGNRLPNWSIGYPIGVMCIRIFLVLMRREADRSCIINAYKGEGELKYLDLPIVIPNAGLIGGWVSGESYVCVSTSLHFGEMAVMVSGWFVVCCALHTWVLWDSRSFLMGRYCIVCLLTARDPEIKQAGDMCLLASLGWIMTHWIMILRNAWGLRRNRWKEKN